MWDTHYVCAPLLYLVLLNYAYPSQSFYPHDNTRGERERGEERLELYLTVHVCVSTPSMGG